MPGAVTADPAEVDLSTDIGGFRLEIPFLAAAMDAVADADFAVRLTVTAGSPSSTSRASTRATRMPHRSSSGSPPPSPGGRPRTCWPRPTSSRFATSSSPRSSRASRRRARVAAVATTPASAWHHAEIAAEAGADLFLVQSQVSSARHISTSSRVLSLADLTGGLKLPVLVGNTVSGEAAYQLMHQGAAASSSASGRAPPARRARCSASACRRCPPRSRWLPHATASSAKPAATSRSSPMAA